MSEVEQIEKNIEYMASMNDYGLTKFAPKIAAAKLRFFGVDNWHKCPCDPDSDRACISERCHREIKENGHCHCNCYCIKETES